MTSRLYLLRHGIAVPHGTPGVGENDRPLTPEGEDRVREIARSLKRLGVKPEAIVTSPLPRARQTAVIVAGVLDCDDRLEESDALVPTSTPESIRDWLGSRTDDSLMLVGHNPSMTGLLARLIGLGDAEPPFEMKKGGIAELRTDGGGPYKLQWLATPRLLRRLAD